MTKKNIIKILTLLIVVCLIAATFTACTFIKENDERVANQTLATVKGPNGITLNVTQYELIEYYSQYAYYLSNYYGYSAEEAFNWAVDNKIKSKYLTIEGMVWLTNVQNAPKRTAALLTGKGNLINPVDALTPAERYAAIQSVNASITSSIDSLVDESRQQALRNIVSKIDNVNVEGIEFLPTYIDADGKIVEGTVASDDGEGYLKDEYFVGQGIDKNFIKFRVIYDTDDLTKKYSEAYVVPNSMYTTDFSSEKAATGSELVISFDEKVTNEDGEVTYEAHTASFTYDVVEARATKNEAATTTDPDEITIGEVKVNRYATEEELAAANAVVNLVDLDAKYEELRSDPNADSAELDAYRELSQTLKNNNRTMKQLYDAAYENAVLTALSVEVRKGAAEVTDADILAEYKFLYSTGKSSYTGVAKDDEAAFGTAIKDGRETLYYYPAVENISGYYYVYQILFKFDDKQTKFLEENVGSDEEIANKMYEYVKQFMKTKESNTEYDASYDCPKHEMGDASAECKHTEDPAKCPSIAFFDEHVVTDLLTDLENELKAAATSAEKVEIFEKYMYKYNDDGGIMNSSSGYLMVPEGATDPNSFYESFNKLAKDVYAFDSTVGNAFTSDGKLGYSFTPYGLHVIMISSTPFGTESNNNALSFENDEAMLQYIKTNKINNAGDTLYDKIKASLKTERETQMYNDFTNLKVKSDLSDDTSIVTKENKKIKKLLKQFAG